MYDENEKNNETFNCRAVLAVTMFSMLPSIQTNAAEVDSRYIIGNGVCLRKEGWTGGTVLELMYWGERINYYPYIFGSDTEYNYMQRIKTGTYGYVDHHYAMSY